MAATRRQSIIQLELRPEKQGTPSFRLLVEALLAAAEEELAWEEERDGTATPGESS